MLEAVAQDVWVVRGGEPPAMNVYLVRDGAGVLAFDAGVAPMADAVKAAAAELGGLTRVVLGHAHPDHRGAAALLGAPVLCHTDNRDDAEGDAGERYFDYAALPEPFDTLFPQLLRAGDAGPVTISDTVAEGDDVAGFEVVLLDGHAPGMIGLWRERDRVVLSSDAFYVMDPFTGEPASARLPHHVFSLDQEQARASLRRLAAMEPALALPGHRGPLGGDVRAVLEHAADTT